MKKLCPFVLWCVLAACNNSDPCTTLVNAEQQAVNKEQPCDTALQQLGLTVSFDAGAVQANCETSYNNTGCTSADRSTLSTLASMYGSCVNGLPSCNPNNPTAFQNSAGACAGIFGDAGNEITPNCSAAFE